MRARTAERSPCSRSRRRLRHAAQIRAIEQPMCCSISDIVKPPWRQSSWRASRRLTVDLPLPGMPTRAIDAELEFGFVRATTRACAPGARWQRRSGYRSARRGAPTRTAARYEFVDHRGRHLQVCHVVGLALGTGHAGRGHDVGTSGPTSRCSADTDPQGWPGPGHIGLARSFERDATSALRGSGAGRPGVRLKLPLRLRPPCCWKIPGHPAAIQVRCRTSPPPPAPTRMLRVQ